MEIVSGRTSSTQNPPKRNSVSESPDNNNSDPSAVKNIEHLVKEEAEKEEDGPRRHHP